MPAAARPAWRWGSPSARDLALPGPLLNPATYNACHPHFTTPRVTICAVQVSAGSRQQRSKVTVRSARGAGLHHCTMSNQPACLCAASPTRRAGVSGLLNTGVLCAHRTAQQQGVRTAAGRGPRWPACAAQGRSACSEDAPAAAAATRAQRTCASACADPCVRVCWSALLFVVHAYAQLGVKNAAGHKSRARRSASPARAPGPRTRAPGRVPPAAPPPRAGRKAWPRRSGCLRRARCAHVACRRRTLRARHMTAQGCVTCLRRGESGRRIGPHPAGQAAAAHRG